MKNLKKKLNELAPYVITAVCLTLVSFFLIVRNGIEEGLYYRGSNFIEIVGCENDAETTGNDLILEIKRTNSRSMVNIPSNESEVCNRDYNEFTSFEAGFYKRYLVFLEVEGEKLLPKEVGIEGYKSVVDRFILGAVLFNIVVLTIIRITKKVHKE